VRPRHVVLLLALAGFASSCAYYNTFYLARKYYFRGTGGLPYPVDKRDESGAQNFIKAIDFSKKVLANYPRSKWVDDAYVLWARSLLGRDDPRETVNMLQDFPIRFPDSDLKAEVLFYLGVGYRQSRRNGEAEATLAQFLDRAPGSDLVPHAWLERSRALTAIDRDSAAAYCASQVIEHFPRSKLGPQALAVRAQALFEAKDYDKARADYRNIGLAADDDDARLTYLLREADCLEAAREYETMMGMLREALAHERPPVVADTAGSVAYQPTPGGDRYGRIQIRIGTLHLLAGRQKDALDAYQEVVRLYPKSPLSAEAQYRVGYLFETAGDDFERARSEYARVKNEFPNSAFSTQAQSRLTNLDRVMQFRSAGGDTLQKQAEAGFLLAELYLFQLGKPERALEEYAKVATEFAGTPWAAKALIAEAWVLSRKLGRRTEADSLFWIVVRHHPATESQLAARDYLEQDGTEVPDSLIKLPLSPAPTGPDTTGLTRPPAGPTPLGRPPAADTAGTGARGGGGLGWPAPRGAFMRTGTTALPPDSPSVAPPDSSSVVPPRLPVGTPSDSLRGHFDR